MVRKYRSPLPLAIGLFGAALFLIVGAVMVVPSSTTDVAENVIGGFLIAVGCWMWGVFWTNGVSLASEGIVKRETFRRMTIPWDAVESFRVAPAPGRPFWRTVLVELRPRGHSYLTTLAGSGRYIERIIAEFEEYRTQLDGGREVSAPSSVDND